MNRESSIDWKVILIVCSIIVATQMGIRNCFGLFLEPISISNNFGKEIFSIGLALQALTWGLSAFLIGMVIDKFGPQKSLAFGIACYGFGVYILSLPTNELLIYGFGTLTGIGLGAGGMSTIVAIIGKAAATKNKSMAMGLVAAAASFGQFIFVNPTFFSIKTYGWQVSILGLSVITFCLMFLIPLLNEKKKENIRINNKKEDFYFKKIINESLINRNYILLALGFFTCGFHVTFIDLHLPFDLTSKGISGNIAAWAL